MIHVKSRGRSFIQSQNNNGLYAIIEENMLIMSMSGSVRSTNIVVHVMSQKKLERHPGFITERYGGSLTISTLYYSSSQKRAQAKQWHGQYNRRPFCPFRC